MRNGRIAVIDDNEGILKTLRIILSREFKEVSVSTTPSVLLSWLRENTLDVVLLDMNFTSGKNTGNEGLYWLSRIREADPDLPVILITAYGGVELAVDALKRGATDFILKPWTNDKLLSTVVSAWELRCGRRKNEPLPVEAPDVCMVGEHPLMENMRSLIRKVAATDVNVLVTGENGTGKDLVAQSIHTQSLRKDAPFVRIDLGAVAPTLFESEMFGHAKGAFTDAKEDRAGKFDTAQGGTLFLDEIGNLSLPLQAKLLAVLQNRVMYRVGSTVPAPVDIRLISATNQELNQAVAEGKFREDLLYRVNTIHIGVPPLRSRGNDLFLLLDFFLKKYADRYGKPLPRITPQAREKLAAYLWPGNVRELQHCVERAVILSDSPVLSVSDFYIGMEVFSFSRPKTLDEMEKKFISEVLVAHKGNLTMCAQQLNISRQTLYNKMKKYNL